LVRWLNQRTFNRSAPAFRGAMLGVAQNPALFLKQGAEFAQLKRR
jgi:hypothetical protein